MKKLIFLLAFFPTAAFANPFRYQTPCYLEFDNTVSSDVCTVIETRESTGALKTRNIFSNKWSLTIKSRFDFKKGFVTWDSHNQFEYKWGYRIHEIRGFRVTMVMPGVSLEEVSWD